MRIEEIDKYWGNPREFYKHCKTFKMGCIPNTQFVEHEKGEIITSPEQIAGKYKDYFEKLLNNSTVNNEESNKENIPTILTTQQNRKWEHRIGMKYKQQ